MAYDIIQTKDGGYAVVGAMESENSMRFDLHLMKFTEKGELLWNKSYGYGRDDIAYSLIQTEDEGFMLAGSSTSRNGVDEDFIVVKTDENGTEEWSNFYGGLQEDICRSIIRTSDGNYLLSGSTRSYGRKGYNSWILKIDDEGKEIWNRTYGGERHDRSYDVVETSKGYVVVGETMSYGNGTDFWLYKIDEEGNLELNMNYGGEKADGARSVTQTKDDELVLSGYTGSFGTGGDDVWIVKTDLQGQKITSINVGREEEDKAYDVVESGNGDKIAIAGKSLSYGSERGDFFLVQVKEDSYKPVLYTMIGLGTICLAIYVIYKMNKKGYIKIRR